MKKKLIFSGITLLALVLTTGTFAYTYPGHAGTTLGATIADAVMTTYELSADQPKWDDILPEGENDSEFLLPSAAGDETNIPDQFPNSGEHWDKVYDLPADDEATYVVNESSLYRRDLYNLTDRIYADGYETILNVTVYFRFAGDDNTAFAKAAIKTYGTIIEGSEESQAGGGAFVTKSYQWEVNPVTNQPWTWEEIDALQAGISIKGRNPQTKAYCTQVYVVVDYEYVITQGAVPDGDLYDITPHPDYTGDLLVKVYLTNTGNLLKAYQYLNMKLYVADSLEAEKTPNYQILSIETGVVLFNIEGGSEESYTVEVIGGSYRLISGDPEEWGEGWNITPEFYCEVAQR